MHLRNPLGGRTARKETHKWASNAPKRPAVRRYRSMIGGDSTYTYVKEWEYESFTEAEEIRARAHAHPAYAEYRALQAEDREKSITIDQRNEVYELLD